MLFDNRFKIVNDNYNAGGMGQILLVEDVTRELQGV